MSEILTNYKDKIDKCFDNLELTKVQELSKIILEKLSSKKKIAVCGNGGSASNSIHICNDLLILKKKLNLTGSTVLSLNDNIAIQTCLSNDFSYEEIFSLQIKNQLSKGDLLIVLSGSGNSKNIINGINTANSMDLDTYGIFGYDGGKSIKLTKKFIHLKVNDMQVSEDMQTIIFHNICKILYSENK